MTYVLSIIRVDGHGEIAVYDTYAQVNKAYQQVTTGPGSHRTKYAFLTKVLAKYPTE